MHTEELVVPPQVHAKRWAILAVMSLSVFVALLDGTIVNVAIPTLARDLGATNRQLQWIVDAYLLVFAGLLLAAGGLGDKFGRRKMLAAGLAVFAATSAYAGSADTAEGLITGRALMGIGAAMIFPATLAIIANVFADAKERAAAIGVWSAVSGIAVAAGPIAGGWLLENFWWGSVFYVNLPIAAVAIIATLTIVPESRDASTPKLDLVGVLSSIAAITALVFTIIEAPERGWLSANTLVGLLLSAALVAGFVVWELRTEHPMLPVRIFSNLRFSAASVSIAAAFFALFGFVFLITQYFQLVQGYSPLQAGVRTLPVAIAIAVSSVGAPAVVERFGTKLVMSVGMVFMGAFFVWVSRNSATTAYQTIAAQMLLLGTGMGMTTAPGTESIMGSLPPDKAGVGSAVNDTTRELGGTLGVAIIGSIFSSIYVSELAKSDVLNSLPTDLQEITEESVASAAHVAPQLGDLAPAYINDVNNAFLSAMSVACLTVAGVAFAGALFAAKFLPARAAEVAQSDDVSSDRVHQPV